MEIDPVYLDELGLLLEVLQIQGVENATIAGGCLRDMLLQKPIKDIDVFYTGDIPELNTTPAFGNVKECGMEYENTGWQVTHDMTHKTFGIPIQMIHVKNKTIKEHIDLFPTCLSRISYTKDGGLEGIDSQFIAHSVDKTLVFDRKVDQAYLDKMKAKFPDWEVIFIKEEFNPVKKPSSEFIDWLSGVDSIKVVQPGSTTSPQF